MKRKKKEIMFSLYIKAIIGACLKKEKGNYEKNSISLCLTWKRNRIKMRKKIIFLYLVRRKRKENNKTI